MVQDSGFAGVNNATSSVLAVLDPANGQVASESPYPPGSVVRARPGGVAVFSESTSRLWWLNGASLSSSADIGSITPIYDPGEPGELVILRSGEGAVVHDDRVVFLGASVEDHAPVALPPGFDAVHVTAAGDQVIAVDDEVWIAATPDGAEFLSISDVGSVAALQQESSASGVVSAVLSSGEPVVLPLVEGEAQLIGGDLSVSPTVRPIWHDDCLFVLGDNGVSMGLWALCADGPRALLPQDADDRAIPENAEMRLVNDRVWLDSLDGLGWTITPELEVLEIDVTDAFDNDSDGDEEDPDGEREDRLNQESDTAETTDADEQDGDASNEPPTAMDDFAGTRLGRSVLVEAVSYTHLTLPTKA